MSGWLQDFRFALRQLGKTRVGDSIAGRRFETVLPGIFGALAFVLTAAGLCGVIPYLMVQRTPELGIRLALAAERHEIVRVIVNNGALRASPGVAIGLGAALLPKALIRSLLYGISPFDPLAFLAVPICLIAMAVLASDIPARRAAKADPMTAPRQE